MFGAKLVLWIGLGFGLAYGVNYYVNNDVEERNKIAYRQFEDDNTVSQQMRLDNLNRNTIYFGASGVWIVLGLLFFGGDISRMLKKSNLLVIVGVISIVSMSGCYKPFEPVVLETIGTSEEGFLIPLRGDKTQQTSTNSEADLQKSLVSTKQVQIPQQWHKMGYETFSYNGSWEPAAILIKVDRSPVTREWTADPNSGTSNKNEAVWVMTSDQVEFSTGWTITARIDSKDNAVKFLHNYPNGSLKAVLDTEVRSKLQAVFGLEVTDLPMDELRRAATPHIQATTKAVSEFFKERGITITNIGITGGFVYKDSSIMKMMVEIFNAEQAKTMAKAATDAQEEKNKKIRMEAEGKAAALLLEKNAEAKGIQAVADAKAYEIEKAQENKELYLSLKRLELESKRQEKWDGELPKTFIGGNGVNMPEMLLNIPEVK